MKNLVYEDEDVLFEYEAMGEDLLLHCEIKQWSHSKFKNMIKVFASFMNQAESLGYKKVFTVTPNPNFAKLFGGRKTNSFEYEGKYYEVVLWD